MRPGDRLVCAFIKDPPAEFKQWPLHITIVPWFRTAAGSTELAREFARQLADFAPFTVIMGKEATFGHGKTVNLVVHPTLLSQIEPRIRTVLKNHTAWLVDETTKRVREFQPHVTAQQGSRLNSGDSFVVGQLYIIEQKGTFKEVVATINL